MTNHGRTILRTAIAAAIFTTTAFSAVVIDLGTNNAGNWSITGAGAAGATALANSNIPGTISITDNSKQDGTLISGGSLGAFNGVWYADFMFFLPDDATNVVLNFADLAGDDRVVLQLNGTDIGSQAVDGSGGGLMAFGPTLGAPSDNIYFFAPGGTGGTVNTGFNLGGFNLVRLVVNNTGGGRTANTQPFISPADATAVGMTGTVTFDSSVPEPGSISLILLGMAPLAWHLRRRRSQN